MNNDPILQAVAERNPVRQIPPYDEAGEAGLRDLLATFRTSTTQPARARTRRPLLVAAGVGGGLVVALVAGVLLSQRTSDPSSG